MSIRFLTEEYQNNYGRYVGEPTALQLARYFHLDDQALQLVKKRRGDHNRLGFAIQLGTVRFLGTFLPNPLDVPNNVINYLKNQLKIKDIDCLSQYLNRIRTHWEHIEEIKTSYGYQDFNSQPSHWRLIRWLYERVWVGAESPSILFDLTTAQLLENKILLPGVTVLAKLIIRVRERVEQRLYFKLAKLPNQEQINKLESLLMIPETSRQNLLEQWRTSATKISSQSLVNTWGKLEAIRTLEIGKLDVSSIPPIRLKALAKNAFTVKAQAITRMSENKRIAILVAFVYVLETTVMDESLDIFSALVKELFSSAEREGKKERLRTIKDLDASALELVKVARKVLEPNCQDSQLREQIFGLITEAKLTEVIEKIETLARLPCDNYYQELVEKWRKVRMFFPHLLKVVEIGSNQAGQSILDAFKFLQLIEGKRNPVLTNAPVKFIPKNWRALVIQKDNTIERKAYTFCFLEQLMKGLAGRDLYVNQSERWSNPSAKLLQGTAWESARSHVCRALNLAQLATPELDNLKQQLDSAYQRTALNLPQNQGVKIETVKGKETLTISNLDQLVESDSYLQLKAQVQTLLPHVDLPEIVRVNLIEQNWDDILRVAGSLKLGTVSATEIMRVLQRGQKPSTLGKAIGELGRIAKTLYLLNYVDDEAYRRRILTQLNRGESRHSLARAVFYGRRGEVRQKYREGQEEQLGALGLVVNAIVLWNTYYMDAALNHLGSQGMVINAEDMARLSPLGYEHINILGRYRFYLSEDLKNGGMRPLRNPAQLLELNDWLF